MMRGRFAVADVRAGWVDAQRTGCPTLAIACRVGATDYRIGYVAAMLARLARGGAR